MNTPGLLRPTRRVLLAGLPGIGFLAAQEPALESPKDALNVSDFEAAARKALPPAHFGYLSTGVDDDATLRANRDAFRKYYLRPRRLVDISHVDTSVSLFGTTWPSPIGFAPVGNQKAFHPDGEIPAAKAAGATNTLMVVSSATTTSFEDASEAAGRPLWYQLYATSRWDYTERLVRRVEAARCPVLVVTVDSQAGRNIETFERLKRLDQRQCVACHGTKPEDFFRRKPMFRDLDMKDVTLANPPMTWDHIVRLRKLTSMKVLLKGIETAEDAKLCRDSGVDGIIVSNHGGRSEESGRGTLDCLPEVVEAAGSNVPVLIDGGIRRGTDVFKALALGARMVFVGRPYVWALAAFGQPGVERAAAILRTELALAMRQCGTTSIPSITHSFVGKA